VTPHRFCVAVPEECCCMWILCRTDSLPCLKSVAVVWILCRKNMDMFAGIKRAVDFVFNAHSTTARSGTCASGHKKASY
jgi:hypothetical protein